MTINIPPELRATRLHPRAILPKYQTVGAACFDLHAVIDWPSEMHGRLNPGKKPSAVIRPGCAYDFGTGIAFEVPPGCVMQVFSRSGHGFKNGLRLANGTGIVDSDFRGAVRVKLHNDSDQYYDVEDGDRIAQCLISPAQQWYINLVNELSESARGESGYGSTGR